jgi:hypothetical protein
MAEQDLCPTHSPPRDKAADPDRAATPGQGASPRAGKPGATAGAAAGAQGSYPAWAGAGVETTSL